MKYILAILVFTCMQARSQTNNMMIRLSEIEINSDSLAAYNAILQQESRASVQSEPGVISIYPMFQKQNPTQIRIVEIYANREAYEAHIKSAHFQKYKTSTLAMVKSLKLVDMNSIDPATMVEIFRKMQNAGKQIPAAPVQNEAVFPKGEIATINNHTGTIWLNELSEADSILNYSVAQASFAAGGKLDWHIHPGGQTLLITEGNGFYQEKGKPVQVLHAGDVIKCQPGVPHWHGATPAGSFAYIAVTPAQHGKTIWLQRVTDEEYKQINYPATNNKTAEDNIIDLSNKKWLWMADKNVDSLNKLFDEKASFVHMGGSWGKAQELDIIRNGSIHYKKADVHKVSANIINNTAIVLSNITLLAVVAGNQVINPFMVTEVYVRENSKWKLGSLSFTKLLMPEEKKN